MITNFKPTYVRSPLTLADFSPKYRQIISDLILKRLRKWHDPSYDKYFTPGHSGLWSFYDGHNAVYGGGHRGLPVGLASYTTVPRKPFGKKRQSVIFGKFQRSYSPKFVVSRGRISLSLLQVSFVPRSGRTKLKSSHSLDDGVCAQNFDFMGLIKPFIDVIKAGASSLCKATEGIPELRFILKNLVIVVLIGFLVRVIGGMSISKSLKQSLLASVPALIVGAITHKVLFGICEARAKREMKRADSNDEKKAELEYINLMAKAYSDCGLDDMMEVASRHLPPGHIFSVFGDAQIHELYAEGLEAMDHDAPVQAQSAAILAPLSAAFVFILGRKTSLYRRVADHEKLSRGINSMLEGALGGFETVINLILGAFGHKGVTLLRAHERIINDWASSVEVFSLRVATEKVVTTDYVVRSEYNALLTAGIKFAQEYKSGVSAHIVARANAKLSSLGQSFPCGAGSARMEPLVIMLRGAPGTGKSTVARVLARYIAMHLCTEGEVASVGGDYDKLVYQKGTSEYWEGYCGQPIVTFDDFLQAKAKPGTGENEVSTFIRACNQWPYPLNMAFAGKGKVYFTSRFIIMTTNEGNTFQLGGLVNCVGAVTRRFDLAFDLSLADGQTVADGNPSWVFTPWDFISGGASGERAIRLDELFTTLSSRYGMRLDTEQRICRLVDRLVPLRQEALSNGPVEPPAAVIAQGGIQTGLAVVGAVAICSKVVKCVRGATGAVKKIQNITNKLINGAAVAAIVACLTMLFRAIPWPRRRVSAQMGSGDEVALALSKNLFEIRYMKDGTEGLVGYATFVDNRTALYNYHFLEEAKSRRMEMYISTEVGRIPIGVNHTGPFKEGHACRDLAIEKFSKPLPGVRCIRAHLRNRGRLEGGDVILLKPMKGSVHYANNSIEVHRYVNTMKAQSMAMVKYDADTSSGDCGSMLILRNRTRNKRILGIHCGGGSDAYYTPVYAEDLDAVEAQGNVCNVQVTKPVYNSGQTGFVHTSYHGALGPTKLELPVLRPRMVAGQLVDPMVKAIDDTFGHFDCVVLPDGCEQVANFVVDFITAKFDFSKFRKLSFEEAVMGADHQYIKPIARGKSPGYPYCLSDHDKRQMFGSDDYTFDTPLALKVRADVEELRLLYAKGVTSVVFRDALKDECVSSSKVAKAQTRLLACSPVHYTILWRQFFGWFTAEFMRTRSQHGGMVGVNPYSHEWSQIAAELTAVDSEVVDGDFKQFDKRQHPVVMRMLCSAIIGKLSPILGEEHVMVGLCEDMIDANHLGGDSYKCNYIYQKEGSLPSGHPATSVLNSMYNMFLFYHFLYTKFGAKVLLNVEGIFKLYVYGDDNIYARHKSLQFTPADVADHFQKFGMVYTGSDKEGPPTGKNLIDALFLKRRFHFDGVYCYAPLEEDSIFDMLNWKKRRTSDVEHFLAVVPAVLRESAAHNFVFFIKNYEKMKSLAKEYKISAYKAGLFYEPFVAFDLWRAEYRGYVPDWSSELPLCPGEAWGDERQPNIIAESGFSHEIQTLMDNSTQQTNKNFDSTDGMANKSMTMHGSVDTSVTMQDNGIPGGDDLQFSGAMRTGLTDVTTLGALVHPEHKHNAGPERSYKPASDLFDRPTAIWTDSVAPGTYGVLAADLVTEANFLTTEAGSNARGYTGVRASIVYTLVVSAPPQTSGILKMAFWPVTPKDTPVAFDKSTIMPMYAQTHHVELNLCEGSTAILKVPYNFYTDYLRINPSFSRDYGTMALGTYTPVGGTYLSAGSMTFTIYKHYEDVELINPGTAVNTVIAQSGLESKAIGPVTAIMRGAVALGNAMTVSPLLSAYGVALSWLAGGVGSVAAHYGWSKPNRSGNSVMQPTVGRNYNTTLGVGTAAEFGMFDNNEVAPITDLNHSGVDEMAICHLCCIPCPIFLGQLDAADTRSMYKWSTVVNTSYFYFQKNLTVPSYTQERPRVTTENVAMIPTTISYIANFFSYWRGDLVFRFKFARTKFTSGRVLIGFNPKPDSNNGEVGNARLNFPSKIVDLRSDSLVDLIVPYSYTTSMCSTEIGNIGVVFMRVLDPIIVPDNAPPTVPFVVEVFSKCGLEFGSVHGRHYAPALNDTPVFAQSGLSATTQTIGECILSIKQLMQRPCWVPGIYGTGTITTTMRDRLFVPYYSAFGSGYNTVQPTPSMCSMFFTAYRFYRGSVVFHGVPLSKDTNIKILGVLNSSSTMGLPMLIEHGNTASVRIPYWAPHKCSATQTGFAQMINEFDQYTFRITATADNQRVDTAFVVGDDFQIGGFTGFPLVVSALIAV